MSPPTIMYHLPKLTSTPSTDSIELPNSMYKMNSVNKFASIDLAAAYYGTGNSTTVTKGKIGGLAELEKRQEAVLLRLQSLKQQLDKLQVNKGINETTPTAVPALGAAVQCSPLKSGTVHDLVISANPERPPYSLILLRKLLKDSGFPVYCANHLHSSIKEVSKALQSSFTHCPEGDRAKHSLAFTIHWKDVTAPTLMVNPLRQTHVSGEANIVRYVSRLFPMSSPFNYEAIGTFASITETDNLLDQLGSQVVFGNNKERQSVLRQYNGRLGRQAWLMGNKCTIIDIMAWSAFKQTGLDNGAPPNVSKWFKACNALAGIQSITSNDEALDGSKKGNQSKVINSLANKKEKKTNDVSKKNMKNETMSKGGGSSNIAVGNGPGGSHITRQGLEQLLKGLGISYQVQDHEEVFTVEALMRNVSKMPGLHMKNLFLKDKKKNLYLLSARHDAEVKLNDVAKSIGAKDIRFGDEAVMFDILGVKQGCVTAYALANDKNHQIKFLLDSEALNDQHKFVNFHPMSNAATMGISPQNLKKFLSHTGHEPTLLTLK